MAKRAKDQKRPADVIAATTAMGDFRNDGKNKAAQWLGQRGGKARAKVLSAKRRKEIAQIGAAARWKT